MTCRDEKERDGTAVVDGGLLARKTRADGWTGGRGEGVDGSPGEGWMSDQLVMDGNDRKVVAKRWVMG